MVEFALIGNPVSHSRSVEYFNQKFISEGIDAYYFAQAIEDLSNLPIFLCNHPALVGFNVTSPYKQSILRYVHSYTEEVEFTQAANMVVVERRGKKEPLLTAHNTDVWGFLYSIKPHLKPHHTKALVLGSGGAARAVSRAFKMMNIDDRMVSRTPCTADALSYSDLTSDLLEQYSIVVNATPVGMGEMEHLCLPLPYEALTPDHLCYDLIYAPQETLFLKKAQSFGATTMNGFSMLIAQAEENWNVWKHLV